MGPRSPMPAGPLLGAVLFGLVAVAAPWLILKPAWDDVEAQARSDLQQLQLQSVQLQADRLGRQVEDLHQIATYLAEDPDHFRQRLWSSVLPATGISEGVRIVLHEAEGTVRLSSADGEPCIDGGLPTTAGVLLCEDAQVRIAATAISENGLMVTVLQDTRALSPLLAEPWAWVIDARGRVVAHADPDQVGSRPFLGHEADPELGTMLARMSRRESGTAAYTWDGEERLAAFAPIPRTPGHVSIATSTDADAAVAGLHGARARLGLAALGLLALGLTAGLGLLVTQRRRHQLAHRQAEERLLMTQAAAHSERLALIGTLTAGVAHDIRSPLTALTTIADLLEEAEPDERDELLVDLQDAVGTMRAIADDLTGFSRSDAAPSGEPAQAIDLAARMVRSRFRGRRRLLVDIAPMDPVALDTRRLSQALMNLCVNAVQAGASEVRITGRPSETGCRICVDDDGPGVPEALRARIFEPFVTTKPEGEGTGLGLHLARRFLESAGGSLAIEDAPLGGARFVLDLPLLAAEPGRAPAGQAVAAR